MLGMSATWNDTSRAGPGYPAPAVSVPADQVTLRVTGLNETRSDVGEVTPSHSTLMGSSPTTTLSLISLVVFFEL